MAMPRCTYRLLLPGFLLTGLAVGAQNGGGEPIDLSVHNPQPIDRTAEVVSGGIPFPRGRVFDPGSLRVSDSSGTLLPTQAHALGLSWPDGSLRWALVQFPATLPANETGHFKLSTAGGAQETPPHPVSVVENADRIIVNTGVIRFSLPRAGVSPGHAFTPQSVVGAADSVSWLSLPAGVRYIADREHLTAEAFAALDLHPNALWSFGLGGLPGEYTGRVLYNRYAVGPSDLPANTVPWHDWSAIIEREVDYSALFSAPVHLQIEESGPLRAVVFFRSSRDQREGDIGFCGRVYAYAGQAAVRIELSIENYEDFPAVSQKPGSEPLLPHSVRISNTKHIRDFSLRFRPAFAARVVRYGTGDQPCEAALGSRLLQDREDHFRITSRDGSELHSGKRAPGWISLSDGRRTLSLATKYFWEVYPKALACHAETGDLVLELWPADSPPPGYPFTPGRHRTYEFVLAFDRDGHTTSAFARNELRPYAGADYVSSTGATHRVLGLADDSPFPALNRFVERTTSRFRDQQLMHGDIHFGDQAGWSRLSAASGYHGVAHEFFVYYQASGDPEHFRLAEAAVWHNLDIDQVHWGSEAGAHVKQHTRLRDHATVRSMGGIAAWNYGDVDYYFLTGRRRVLPALERTADWLLQCSGFTPETFTNERAAGLPFRHLAYMIEAIGDETGINAIYPGTYSAPAYPNRNDAVSAEKTAAYMRRLREVAAHFIRLYEANAVRPVPFMASYPPEGFYRLWRLTGDAQARRGVELGAAFIYHQLVLPTGSPCYSADERTHLATTPYANWSIFPDEADLPAALAYEVTGDSRYLEYAKAPLEWRLVFHGIAYPYNGFNSTIPRTLWRYRAAGFSQDDLHRLRPDLDYAAALDVSMARARTALDSPGTLGRGEAETYLRLAFDISRVLANLGRADEALAWLAAWRTCWEPGRQAINLRGFELIEVFEAHARQRRREQQ